MNGTDILERARKELKDFIVYEVKQLYNLLYHETPNFEDDEDWVIEFSELSKIIKIKITIDVICDDDFGTIPEKRILDSIRVGLDDNLFFTAEEDDDEIHYGELRVEELADIANYLEEKFYNFTHNK